MVVRLLEHGEDESKGTGQILLDKITLLLGATLSLLNILGRNIFKKLLHSLTVTSPVCLYTD